MKKVVAFLLTLALILSFTPMAFAEEKVEIVLWNQLFEDWNREWCEKQVEAFNADPLQTYTIRQEFVDGAAWNEKLMAARAAGTAPDILLVNYGNLVWNAVDGLILPLDDLIPQSAWDDLHDNVRGFVTVNGQKFAYPQLVEPAVVMYYRKDMYEAAGLDPNAPPKTWAEFKEYAEKLTTDDVFGTTLNYEWSMWGWEYSAAGHWPISEDWSQADCEDKGYVDLLAFFGDMYASETVPAQALEGYNGSARLVGDGSVAMTFSGSWGIGALLHDFPEMKEMIGVAAAPTQDGSPFQSTVGGWTYVVDAKSKNPEGAAAYINWLLGDDPARTGSFFEAANFSKYSPRKSVDEYLMANTAASTDEWMQIVSTDIIPFAVAEPIYTWDVSAALLTAIGEVVTNGMTPEAALAAAAEQINQYIANNDYAAKKPQ